MKLTSRFLATATVGLGLVGLLGCQEDNEKAATITSAPPPAGTAGPAKTQAEQFQRSQGTANLKGQGYPGAPQR